MSTAGGGALPHEVSGSIQKLRRVKLRDVWKHEAHDFTRWLVENIDVVSEATGVELAGAEPEQSVGSFSVDVVAETEAGETVAIENQLERSDHDHLGKLLTYTSNLDARVAIWIVAEPRPEHVAAVTWLNEAGLAAFYLLKVEAVAIGDSAPAPLLTLIVGPTDETSSIGASKKGLAHAEELRLRFWTGVLAEAKKTSTLHAGVSPNKYTWVGTGAGKSGLGFNYVVKRHGSRAELYIDLKQPELSEAVFHQLHEHRNDIEARFGGALNWDVLPGRQSCRISVEMPGGYEDLDDPGAIHADLAALMNRFAEAVRPAVVSLP